MSEENKNIQNDPSPENEVKREESAETGSTHASEVESYAAAGRYNSILMQGTDSENAPEDEKKGGEKRSRKISLSTFLLSSVAIALVTVMMTWSLCLGLYRKQLSDIVGGGFIGSGAPSGEIDLIASILEQYSYYDLKE